ncbi:VanZ family protein [Streptomyces sp. ADMS]|uniref:VanZ family protein n=1 Tax=Streptomyces sp. ADMS TaxID=3071415 RepID=UPI00296F3563|nr:VanZ family protein [Streptomyces sp. ADMS]MDW4904966.1 VanZ family protein [Streptomyces sp. ADMS]
MARSAPRTLAALRLRPAKAESKPPETSPKSPPKSPPRSSWKLRRTPKTSAKTAPKASPKPPEEAPPKRRPFAFLARVLTVLCAFVFMVAFAVILARLTLEPSPASVALTHTNFHPGRSLRAYLDQPEMRDAIRQIGGNLLLGVPFGILVPVVAPRTRGVLRVLFLTATVMLMVEVAQGALITGRAFDIDDVILNTSGALIGYLLLGRRLSRAVHAPKRRA